VTKTEVVVSTTGKCYIFNLATCFDLRGSFSDQKYNIHKMNFFFSCVKFWADISFLQFDKIHVPATNMQENVKRCPIVSWRTRRVWDIGFVEFCFAVLVMLWVGFPNVLSCCGDMLADIGVWLAPVLILVACPFLRKKNLIPTNQSTT